MDIFGALDQGLTAAFGEQAMYFAIAAIGLNIHYGYTGLLNFGQAGFMAVGAYGMAITVTWGNQSMWLGIVVGLLAALVLALILGIPTLRLRADYLAIVTIAAAEIIRFVVRAAALRDFSGGSGGLQDYSGAFFDLNPYGTREYTFWFFNYRGIDLWVMTVGWSLVLLLVLGTYLLTHSPWGRVLKGVREDEDAVRALGKNAYGFKMQSLILGGLIGAVGGMMFALAAGSVQPDLYGTATTFFLFTALILGGAGRVWGPVLGSMLFWFLIQFTDVALRDMVARGTMPEAIMSGVQVGQFRFILVGLGLILLMVFRPQGILGDRRELALDD